jgi:hypothetical protein
MEMGRQIVRDHDDVLDARRSVSQVGQKNIHMDWWIKVDLTG